jgi:hypothetical protein
METKAVVKSWMKQGLPIWKDRPLAPQALYYAIDNVKMLAEFTSDMVWRSLHAVSKR